MQISGMKCFKKGYKMNTHKKTLPVAGKYSPATGNAYRITPGKVTSSTTYLS